MLRGLLRSSQSISTLVKPVRLPFPCVATPLYKPTFQWRLQAKFYSASAGLSKDEINGRVMELLKNFDKVKDTTKLTETSHFNNDLGLDSLDTVEVVMAIEEEFGIEMPDKDANEIHSVDQAVDYVMKQPDAH